MLTVTDNLSSYTLGAGEPFLLQVAFLLSNNTAADISGRAFVLSLYRSDRTLVTQMAGLPDTDVNGAFLRFERDGTFSEGLAGQSNIKVELAERFLNGRNVIATGSLTINSTAATVPSLQTAPIGVFAARVAIRESQTVGGAPSFSQHAVVYAAPTDAGTLPPAPTGFAPNGATNGTLKAALLRVKAGTGRAKIAWMGDSTDVGCGAGTGSHFTTGARPHRAASTMAAALSSAGIAAIDKGFIGDSGMTVTVSDTLSGYDSRITFTGDVAIGPGENFAGGGYVNVNNGGGSVSFTETDVDTFVFSLYTSNTGTFAVTIDGAAPATGPATVTPGNAGGFVRYVVTAASVGTHTLTLTQTVTGTPAIFGVRAYNSTVPAIDFAVLASAGAQTGDQASMNAASHWNALDALKFSAPDLTIVGPYFNDPGNGVALATSIQNLQSIITAAKLSGDVLLLSKYPAGGAYGSGQAAANTAIKNLAAQNNIACMSFFDFYGGAFTTDFASRLADGVVHGKAPLYVEMGGALSNCLQLMAA